jgi:hypothetical protein
MVLFHGEEKNIFQNEVHGEVMLEMVEAYIFKQMKILILFQNIDIKKFLVLKNENEEVLKIETEQIQKI